LLLSKAVGFAGWVFLFDQVAKSSKDIVNQESIRLEFRLEAEPLSEAEQDTLARMVAEIIFRQMKERRHAKKAKET